jgi:hypothetical protein
MASPPLSRTSDASGDATEASIVMVTTDAAAGELTRACTQVLELVVAHFGHPPEIRDWTWPA